MKHLKIFEDVIEEPEDIMGKFLPYAEEGITYDELELLSRSKKNNWAHKDFENRQQSLNPDEWNPELIIRIHGILMYLVLKELRKGSTLDDEFDEGMKIYWTINQNHHEVHVSLRHYGSEIQTFTFDYVEVSNPIRNQNMKKFDL